MDNMTKRHLIHAALLVSFAFGIAPAAASDDVQYWDEKNGFSLRHSASLKPLPPGESEEDVENEVLLLRDPTFEGADAGDSTPVKIDVMIGQPTDFPRPAMIDYLDMQTPVKPKISSVKVSGIRATELVYRNGAPEGATDVLIITEINAKGKAIVIRGRYTVRGCARQASSAQCKKEVAEEDEAKMGEIERLVKSFKLKK